MTHSCLTLLSSDVLVTGAQDVGRADIARSDLADVAESGHSRQAKAERNRTEKIAEDGCRDDGGQRVRDPRHRSVLCLEDRTTRSEEHTSELQSLMRI